MKSKLIFLYLICICYSSVAQPYFQNIYADSIFGESTMCISPDAYYLLQTNAPPAFTPKIIKVDLNGNKLWSRKITFNGNNVGVMNIQYHNNGLLLTGGFQNAGYYNFVSKLDTSGNVLWTQQIGYGDINVNTEIIPLTTGFLLCGHRDILQGSIYTFDITLARFDDGGNLVWAKAHGTSFLDFVCSSAAKASNGDIIIAGSYGVRTPPDYDPMIARFDSSGNLIWMKYFNDPSGFFTSFIPTDMCATSDGNFALTGFSKNTNVNYDPHVIKIDNSGNILWAKRLYQISWQEYGNSIICDSQNNIVIAGPYYYLTDYGDFAAKLDLAGNYLGSSVVTNTSRNQPQLFSDIYNSHGNDLFERVGNGYAYSTSYYHDYNHHSQCLVTSDYFGSLNCTALGGTYPFSVSNIAWSVTNVAILPTPQTNITASVVSLAASVIPASQVDICLLAGVEDLPSLESIKIFPNPVKEELQIMGKDLKGILKITDSFGRQVYYDEVKNSVNSYDIVISALSQGIYWLEWHSENKKRVLKFIKQ